MNPFKPGDWVKYKDQQDTTIYKVMDILSNDLIDIEDTIVDKYDIELWQPKLGEWCWFWSKSFPKPQLLPFRSYFKNNFYSTEYGVTIFNGVLCECNYFDYCEPFIRQLPTHIKDQS